MVDLARPALPEVLAALTADLAYGDEQMHQRIIAAWACAEWADKSTRPDGWCAGPLSGEWTTTNPVEAAELLTTRGVLPEGWHGDVRRGWACQVCGGKGSGPGWTGPERCGACSRGLRSSHSSLPDLVAVASLGWPAIQRAEELARAACHALREYGCPTPDRVVWRVGYRLLPGDFAWRLHGSYGVQRDGAASFPGGITGPVRPVAALWAMGLALDRITPDAVVVVVPPVGGAR